MGEDKAKPKFIELMEYSPKAIIKIAGHIVGKVDLHSSPDRVFCLTYECPKSTLISSCGKLRRNIRRDFGLRKIRLPRKLKKKLKKNEQRI